MNPNVSQLLIQTGIYAVLMLLSIFLVSALLRGFFLKYVKVRMSFGKLILIKVRSVLRDYYVVGKIQDGFLIFKKNKQEMRIAIDAKLKKIYRCLSVNWIDIDEEKNAICTVDYEAVSGFDIEKFSNLLTRALTRPTVKSNETKIIIVMLILVIVGILAVVYLGYTNREMLQQLPGLINGAVQNVAAASKSNIIASKVI